MSGEPVFLYCRCHRGNQFNFLSQRLFMLRMDACMGTMTIVFPRKEVTCCYRKLFVVEIRRYRMSMLWDVGWCQWNVRELLNGFCGEWYRSGRWQFWYLFDVFMLSVLRWYFTETNDAFHQHFFVRTQSCLR